MSARNTRPRSIRSDDQPRKSLSFQDKLAEARERRAELMAGTKPANSPMAASPIRESTDAESTVAPPPPEDAPAADKTPSASRKLARGLMGLLVILIIVAVADRTEGGRQPAPDFAPPEVSLSFAEPGGSLRTLDVSLPDPAVPSATAPVLRRADPDAAPAVRTTSPAPRGPFVVDTVALPELPSALPANIVTLSNTIRPPHRPDDGASN